LSFLTRDTRDIRDTFEIIDVSGVAHP